MVTLQDLAMYSKETIRYYKDIVKRIWKQLEKDSRWPNTEYVNFNEENDCSELRSINMF